MQGKGTPLTGWMNWQTPEMEFELTKSTTVDLNVLLSGTAGCWGTMDNWILVQTKAAKPDSLIALETERDTVDLPTSIITTRDQLLEKKISSTVSKANIKCRLSSEKLFKLAECFRATS